MSEQKKKNAIVQPAPLSMGMEGPVNPRQGFTGFIPEECFFDDYDDETFQSIMEEQKAMIKLLKSHGESKYLANRILIIFDDLVGSSLFAGSRGSYFKGVNTRHRHYSASFIMVTQGKFFYWILQAQDSECLTSRFFSFGVIQRELGSFKIFSDIFLFFFENPNLRLQGSTQNYKDKLDWVDCV